MKETVIVTKKIGRPLSFNRGLALEKAMLTFWQHGYETTSINDLTTVMGITAPSIYTAFGDKKSLFLEAVKLYTGSLDDFERSLFEAPTARDAARTLLLASAKAFTNLATPKGCLLASATASGSSAASDVQDVVAGIRHDIRARLNRRIERDVREGHLPQSTNTEALAAMVIAIIQGMSILARDGYDQLGLFGLVEVAMQAWPNENVSDSSLSN